MAKVVSAWDRPNGTTVYVYDDGTHRVVRIPDAVMHDLDGGPPAVCADCTEWGPCPRHTTPEF